MARTYTIITGATSGIGHEIAVQLYQQGHHLILGNRNQEKAKALKAELEASKAPGACDTIPLDLSSFASIQKFAETVKKKYDHINILINNAGLLLMRHQQTEEGFEMTLGVNYLGTYLLTELLIDKLTNNSKAKVIFLSSIVAKYGKCKMSMDFFKNDKKGFVAYFNSKLALMMYARELQEKYKDRNLIVKAVHPGIVYTHIWKWHSKIGQYIEKIQASVMKNAREGALMPVKFATTSLYDNDNHLYYTTNKALRLPKQIEDSEFRKSFIGYTKQVIYEN